MKRFFLLILIVFVALSFRVTADPEIQDTVGVGIVEQLGSHIPLDLKFLNEKGDPVTLKDLINKPAIFVFVDLECPDLCTPLLLGVADAIENTGMKLGKDFQVITVSFNFKDTPQEASKKKAIITYRFPNNEKEGWTFLTADSATVYKAIAAFGIKIKIVNLEIIHPSAITVVSQDGMITRYLYGTSFLPFDVKMALLEAGKDLPRPTIQKVLLYCFGYNTGQKHYALEVLKLAAILIIFFALVFLAVMILISGKRRKKLSRKDKPQPRE